VNRTILRSGIPVALASVALITSLEAQDFPPGFPREGSRKVLENSDVLYVPAGTDVPSEEATEGPPRAVFIELK
jgi:hypothetical protein